MPKPKLRFSFVIPNGPNAGSSGGNWIIWTHKQDTYIAEQGLAGKWKTSLHGDAAWRHAVTSEHARASDSVLPKGVDRAPWKFTPTKFVRGHRLAFVIAVTRGSMLPADGTQPWGKRISVQDRWDRLTFAGIYMTECGVDLDLKDLNAQGVAYVSGPLSLANGRKVWLTKRTQEVDGEPEDGIVSSAIFPLNPKTDGVIAPTLLLQGVRLG